MRHFYRLYRTKSEMIKKVAYFLKEGIGIAEYCFWAVPEPMYNEDVISDLKPYIPLIDHYMAREQIKAVNSKEWYMPQGVFSIKNIIGKWIDLYQDAMSKGFTGLRVVGDASWASEKDWDVLIEYEQLVNEAVKDVSITALCLFDLKRIKSVVHISDIIKTHEACFA